MQEDRLAEIIETAASLVDKLADFEEEFSLFAADVQYLLDLIDEAVEVE